MTTEIDSDVMMQAALADIQTYGRRAAKSKHLETAREMADNGYPCMETLLRAVMAKFAEQDEVLDELLSNEESMIQPELAAQIFATLELAKTLCGALKGKGLDEETTKLVTTLEVAVMSLEPQIAEVAVPVGEDDATEVEGEAVGADEDEVAEVA